jgi:hypothetical protein
MLFRRSLLLDSLGAQFPMVFLLDIAPDTSTTVAVPPACGVALFIAILPYSLEEAKALDVVFQLSRSSPGWSLLASSSTSSRPFSRV